MVKRINDDKLRAMWRDGIETKVIAEHFGVKPPAVCRAAKLDFNGDTWLIDELQPHVSIRFKDVFKGVEFGSCPPFYLRDRHDRAFDLNWLHSRCKALAKEWITRYRAWNKFGTRGTRQLPGPITTRGAGSSLRRARMTAFLGSPRAPCRGAVRLLPALTYTPSRVALRPNPCLTETDNPAGNPGGISSTAVSNACSDTL